jgi:hypothetical protein
MDNEQIVDEALALLHFPCPDPMYGYAVLPGKYPEGDKGPCFTIYTYSWSGGPRGINKPKLITRWSSYKLAVNDAIRRLEEDCKQFGIPFAEAA